MADTVQKGDFVELDYTARLQDEGTIFDTTKADVAAKEHLHLQKNFKPLVAVIGESHVLKGLDTALVGKEYGSNHTITITAEEGFGKKNPKLLQLVPRKVFKEQNIQPMTGLELQIDGQVGTVRTVSGGRIIVDFNHPLSGKDLIYDVEIKRKITAQKEQVEALMSVLRIPFKNIEITDETVKVNGVNGLPPQFAEIFAKDVVRLTGVKDITFTPEKEDNNNKV